MTPTHATIAAFVMDPGRSEENAAVLRGVIAPGVSRSEGFVAGCWTGEAAWGTTQATVLFSSESDARAFAASVQDNEGGRTAQGIRLTSIQVVEVVAYLQRT